MDTLVFNLVSMLGLLILAITVHEFAHIAVARWLGDDLGTRLGRFTLDPFKHIDPIWTVALPAALIAVATLSSSTFLPLFAAGKPAPYNPLAFNRTIFGKKMTMRTGELLVAVAGPLANLLVALVTLIGLKVSIGYGAESMTGALFQFLVTNVALFVFNLIPIPPLDGSRVLISILPRRVAEKFERMAISLSWVLLGFIFLGGAKFIGTVVEFIINKMSFWVIG